MGFKSESYIKMLLDLLPNGLAWPKEKGSNLYKAVEAVAEELSRIDARGMRLVEEVDPRTTFEMLTDWERVLGLPDECSELEDTLQRRRAAVLAKLTSAGSIRKQYFIDLASFLGFDISVHEYRPFRAGHSCAGDPLTNGDWVFAWRVDAPLETVIPFRAGRSTAGEPLATWGNEPLECAIEKRAPAGTIVLFSYGG